MYNVPIGFRLAGVHCGIKQDPAKEDLTLVVCDRPATAAAVYTQNLIVAAPVVLDRERTPNGHTRVVVINSGNANACTAERGLVDARRMAELAGVACGASANDALVLSTGIIGEYLPMQQIEQGVPLAYSHLGNDEAALTSAARGMMTTDAFEKIAGRQLSIDGSQICITGFAKGAGMIGPNMATMLAVVMTDAAVAPADAQRILADTVDTTFNCIQVDGHTSTNDTVLLLASGGGGSPTLVGDDLNLFQEGLLAVCTELARAIPSDGEGASHLITIDVRGCGSLEDARKIARAIASSPLVKTAISGCDPNWGRMVSAAGYAGVSFDPNRVGLKLNGFELYREGAPVEFKAREVSTSIRENSEARIEIDLGGGDASTRFWTSDLTADYVRLNSDYHT